MQPLGNEFGIVLHPGRVIGRGLEQHAAIGRQVS